MALYYECDRVFGDSISFAIIGVQPLSQVFGTLARVAGIAASRDILERDNRSIVDNMLPRGNFFP